VTETGQEIGERDQAQEDQGETKGESLCGSVSPQSLLHRKVEQSGLLVHRTLESDLADRVGVAVLSSLESAANEEGLSIEEKQKGIPLSLLLCSLFSVLFLSLLSTLLLARVALTLLSLLSLSRCPGFGR